MAKPDVAMPTDLRLIYRRRSSEINHINRIRNASSQRMCIPLYEVNYPKGLRVQRGLSENTSKSKFPQTCKFHKDCKPEECYENLIALDFKNENLKSAHHVPAERTSSSKLKNKTKLTQLRLSDENASTETTQPMRQGDAVSHGSQNQQKSVKFQDRGVASNKKRHTIRQIDVSNALKHVNIPDVQLDVEAEGKKQRKKSDVKERPEKTENLQKDTGKKHKKPSTKKTVKRAHKTRERLKQTKEGSSTESLDIDNTETEQSKKLKDVKNKRKRSRPSASKKATESLGKLNDDGKKDMKEGGAITHDKKIAGKSENLLEESGKSDSETSSPKQSEQTDESVENLKQEAKEKNTAENLDKESALKLEKSKEDSGRKDKQSSILSASEKISKSDDQLNIEGKPQKEASKKVAGDKGSSENVQGGIGKNVGKTSSSKTLRETPGLDDRYNAEERKNITTESQYRKNIDEPEEGIQRTRSPNLLRKTGETDDNLKKDAKKKSPTVSNNVENIGKARESKENIEKISTEFGQPSSLKKASEPVGDDQANEDKKQTDDRENSENLQENIETDIKIKEKQIDQPSETSGQTTGLKDDLKTEAKEKNPTERQDVENAGKSVGLAENTGQNAESGTSKKKTGSKDQLDVEGKSPGKVSGVSTNSSVEKSENAQKEIRKSIEKTNPSNSGSNDNLKEEAKKSEDDRDKENTLNSENYKEDIGKKAEETSQTSIPKKTSQPVDQLDTERKEQRKLDKKETDHKGSSENVPGDTEKYAGNNSPSKTVRGTSGSKEYLKAEAKEKTPVGNIITDRGNPEKPKELKRNVEKSQKDTEKVAKSRSSSNEFRQADKSGDHENTDVKRKSHAKCVNTENVGELPESKDNRGRSRKLSHSSAIRKISKSVDRLKSLLKKPKDVSGSGNKIENSKNDERETIRNDTGRDDEKSTTSHAFRKTTKLLEKPKTRKNKLGIIPTKKLGVKRFSKKLDGIPGIKRNAATSKTLRKPKTPVSNKDTQTMGNEEQTGELKKRIDILPKKALSSNTHLKVSPSTKDIIVLKWLHGLNCPKSGKEGLNESHLSALTAAPIRILKKPSGMTAGQGTANEKKVTEKERKDIKSKSPKLGKHKKDETLTSSNTETKEEGNRNKSSTEKQNKTQKSSSLQSGKKTMVESNSKEKQNNAKINSTSNEDQKILEKIPYDVEMYISELGKLQIMLDLQTISPEDAAVLVWLENIPKENFTPDFRKPLSITSHTKLESLIGSKKIHSSQSCPDCEDIPVPKPKIYSPSVTIMKNLAVDSKVVPKSMSEDFASSIYYKRCNLSHLD